MVWARDRCSTTAGREGRGKEGTKTSACRGVLRRVPCGLANDTDEGGASGAGGAHFFCFAVARRDGTGLNGLGGCNRRRL